MVDNPIEVPSKNEDSGEVVTLSVIHDLNNKLTGVLGYAQLLGATRLTKKQEKYSGIIESEVLQAKKIIESLLRESGADSAESDELQ